MHQHNSNTEICVFRYVKLSNPLLFQLDYPLDFKYICSIDQPLRHANNMHELRQRIIYCIEYARGMHTACALLYFVIINHVQYVNQWWNS